MSQAHDDINAIIHETMPKLIKSLTNFERSDENFTICEQYAHSTIRNHRFLSVNSHEIRRQIEGLIEGFSLSNCEKYAVELKEMYESLVNDPLCLEHYEHDIQWSVLSFLLTMAYNPVRTLRKKVLSGQTPYLELPPIAIEIVTEDNSEIILSLKEDNISMRTESDSNDSDLSEWSDSEEYTKSNVADQFKTSPNHLYKDENNENNKTVVVYNPIESPKRQPCFTLFDSSKASNWLETNVQSRWWLSNNAKADVNSLHEGSNFCEYWNHALSKVSHGFIKPNNVSTISEYCLLREILWMLSNPTNCKFFRIEDDQIKLNSNVSLASTTEKGLQKFLQNFTVYMTIIYKLKNFCQRVHAAYRTTHPPHTYECYIVGIEDCLDNLQEFIIEKEKDVAAQMPDTMNTVITLRHDLLPHFKILEYLWDIHKNSVLDWNKYPAHICSTHLLSGLYAKVISSANRKKTNLAFVLLLTTLKVYISIIDTWWTEGRLDDWRDEFLVERTYSEDTTTVIGYSARLFSKCKKRSFYVNSNISQVIENDPIIELLMRHSLQAGCSLNILYTLDRIVELKTINNSEDNTLYKIFVHKILAELEKFNVSEDTEKEKTHVIENNEVQDINVDSSRESRMENLKNQLFEIDDELVSMVFQNTLKLMFGDNTSEGVSITKSPLNVFDLYQKLNSFSNFLILPLENVLYETVKTLLEIKISAANQFVTRIYKEEFHVMQHLKNIRKVLLLESSDLMQFFYSNLFKQIEAGEPWANPYLLTIQLNDIMSSRFTDMTSLFSIAIKSENKCDTHRVIDAIDEIKVLYNVSTDLNNMINDKTMENYNCVFRFLLKVKWGLCTLETLKFPDAYKKRRPYAELQMLDLIMKRFAMLKFWMIYSVQCIHSHLMTHILQSLGMQLDEKLEKAENLNQMVSIHDSYIHTIYDHCFQMDDSKNIRDGITRLLNLVYILRDEWNNTCMITDMDEHGDIEDNSMLNDFISNSHLQVEEIENTYCRCHQLLGEILNKEVYTKHKSHLTGLCAAFNDNVPH